MFLFELKKGGVIIDQHRNGIMSSDPEMYARYQGATPRRGSCVAYGVDGAVRGSMIGCMWGLFSSSFYGWNDNLRGKMLARHIGRNLVANGCGFAAFLGV